MASPKIFSANALASTGSDVPSHGLRKAGATRAAERGATSQQLMAVFGWRSLAEAELYTRTAERKRLAADATGLIAPMTGRK